MGMHDDISVDAIINDLANHQIRWDRVRDRIGAAAATHPGRGPDHHLGPYVAVSGLPCAGTKELASTVARTLGWPLIDDQLVDMVAEHLRVNPSLVHLLDETASTWVSDVLGEFWPKEMPNRDTFVRNLKRVVQLLALHGDVVIVGHGGGFFLPPHQGLHVWIVAPEEHRLARIMNETGDEESKARRKIEEETRQRRDHLKRILGHDATDPTLYDMVLNSARQPLDVLSDVVVAAAQRAGLTNQAEEG